MTEKPKAYQTLTGDVVIPLQPQSIGAKISAALPAGLGTDDRAAILLAALWGEFSRTRGNTVAAKYAFAAFVENVLNQIPVDK